ncbi:MAG: hypothetical protein KAW92_06440 [Candidatus Cloacimonetes bacterium]|nr:hypothetical protein [Candidatus Cloacimonadota bacterium]
MKKIIALIIILIYSSSLSAEKYAGEFLNLGVGVKAKSLGNAFVSIADDPTAIYWNSAGMQNSQNISFDIIHSEEYAGNLKYDAFALIYPFDNNTNLGLLLTRIGISGNPFTKLLDPEDISSVYVDKYVTYSDYAGYIAFSSKLSSKISYGFCSKIIYKDIGNISASGLGLDIGLLLQANKYIKFGINLRDIFGTPIWWNNSNTERVNPNIFAGMSIDFTFPILVKPATLSLQSDIFFEDRDFASQLHYKKISADFHAGLGINLSKYLKFYSGYDRKYPTAGLEISYKQFKLNYAFQSNNDLSNCHRVSVGIR